MGITCVNCGYGDSHYEFFTLPIELEKESYGNAGYFTEKEKIYGCPKCGTIFLNIWNQLEYYPHLKDKKEVSYD